MPPLHRDITSIPTINVAHVGPQNAIANYIIVLPRHIIPHVYFPTKHQLEHLFDSPFENLLFFRHVHQVC
jgi:hypothetical protein